MPFKPILQCTKNLDFQPRRVWPKAWPAFAWKGELLCAFDRIEGEALDLFEQNQTSWLEAFVSCHPTLTLGEWARLFVRLPEWAREFRAELSEHYGWRWSARLEKTLNALNALELETQNWIDDKKIGARELAPLLAVENVKALSPLFSAWQAWPFTHAQTALALELATELFLLGHGVHELLPHEKPDVYLKKLSEMRRPRTENSDEVWRARVRRWPWPAHVQGQWQRIGDQAGLEIKIHALSPDDLRKKLQRLEQIPDVWSCPE